MCRTGHWTLPQPNSTLMFCWWVYWRDHSWVCWHVLSIAEEEWSDDSSRRDNVEDRSVAVDSSQLISPRRHRSRRQSDPVSADCDTRRCRSLSRDRGRQGNSPTRAAAADIETMDGVRPLAQDDASLVRPDTNTFGHGSLSLSIDSVNASTSGNKRKAVATLPGKDQKSHRVSL